MSTKILLKKATRIEGNADIQIEVQDGRVETARFMVQDFRGFEKLTQGKMVDSVPHIVSRICGLCSTAHQVAGIRAIEDALGIEVPAPVRIGTLVGLALVGGLLPVVHLLPPRAEKVRVTAGTGRSIGAGGSR